MVFPIGTNPHTKRIRMPSRLSQAGRILRVLRDGKPRTRAQIRLEAGLHPDAEVCRRLRELRDYDVAIDCTQRRDATGRTIWEYQMKSMPFEMRERLMQETTREAS